MNWKLLARIEALLVLSCEVGKALLSSFVLGGAPYPEAMK